jgi:hypothetical protein
VAAQFSLAPRRGNWAAHFMEEFLMMALIYMVRVMLAGIIVIVTCIIGWALTWYCVLSEIPAMRELLGAKPLPSPHHSRRTTIKPTHARAHTA